MSWNQQLVKVNNKSLVLKTIKEQSPISRVDIAQNLGVTKGTVSSLVNELLEEKLCYESGPGESSGGRRPVMLIFNEKAGYSIGIDLGVNYILGVLTDLTGNKVCEKNKVVNRANYKETLLNIKEIIQYLISSAPKSEYGIVGIGVAVPGIVNNDGSNILLAPNLGWKNVNLKHDLEEEYNIPVIIHNEANAGAYGEKHFGSGKDFENLIYLSAGIGIGVGFILNNELYRGADGFSGEMGHMMIDINGRECSCGSTGCWELYASEQALINQVEYLETIIQKDPNLELLIELAQDNEEIRILFYHIGRYLGLGISNIINTFNPKQIIIGNRLALAKELLIQPIMEAVETHSLRYNQKNIKINFAELSNYSAALGISAFVTEFFLKPGLNEKI